MNTAGTMTRPSPRHRRSNDCRPRSLTSYITFALLLVLAPQILNPAITSTLQIPPILPTASASGILTDLASSLTNQLFPPEDDIDDDGNVDLEAKTLTMLEISDMRARDIKRRLARSHGYGADELAKMIDKTDLINTLSFEEHKVYVQEVDRRKWIRFKRMAIWTCCAVLVVMFWPLLKHAWEVAHVNFVVYTDKRIHEIGRCREFNSYKGYVGIFLLFIIDILSFWLSVSVLLSWVMTSKYFFPIPQLPIRPVELLTPKGHNAGALGKYGFNIGPMITSWLFRFLNGQVEAMIGRSMAQAFQNQRKKEMKQRRKEERAKEKDERREARRVAKEREEEEKLRRKEMEQSQKDAVDAGAQEGESSLDDVILNSAKGVPLEETVSSNFDDLD